MTVLAGKLTQRIQIEAPQETRGEFGDVVKDWALHAEVWAHVRNISGREYTVRGLDLGTVNTSIRIRLNRSIRDDMRVLYRGQVYAIVAVLHDDAGREYTDLVCSVGANDGR